MGCKIILFLQPIQLFKLLYFNILKKDMIFSILPAFPKVRIQETGKMRV